MRLVEKHNIKQGSECYREVDNMAYRCKNLYNSTLYAIRQHFFATGKYLKYADLQKQFQETNQYDYRQLPTKVAQWTMKLADQNFRSFFKSLKDYKVHPEKYTGRPCIPHYLDKVEGRSVITFTSQAISKRLLETEGVVKPSGLELRIETQLAYDEIQQVRIVKRTGCYVAEIVHGIPDVESLGENGRIAAIDLGVGNLATVVSNDPSIRPYVISGKKLKSINHRYNQRKAHYQSLLETRNGGKKTSKKIQALACKRNNQVNDTLHKASRMIVNQLIVSETNTLVVGKNKGWKQDINIGAVNNQTFTEIPHARFIEMLRYKCAMAGILLIEQEESHTSKCSFLDGEEICHHEHYCGRRIKRGLFRTKDGRLVNADVNGAYNIMRKCKPNAFEGNGVEGVLVHPVVIKTTH